MGVITAMMELTQKYEDLSESSSYAGASTVLKRILENEITNAPKKLKPLVSELKQLESYAIHRPIVRKFKRVRILVHGVDEMWQADLVDLRSLATRNKNFNYLLTVIDVLSKYAFVEPLKKKDGPTVAKAFVKIFDDSLRVPEKLVTDWGKEFINKDVKKILDDYDVELILSQSDKKACVIERFNRTLKTRMWRFFTGTGYFKYIEHLQDFVRNYNDTYHSAIKMKPKDVNLKTYKSAWENLYKTKWPGKVKLKQSKFKHEIGDEVRLNKVKGVFDKGYLPSYSKEIYKIHKRINWEPPVYKLLNPDNSEREGIYYENEIQSVK